MIRDNVDGFEISDETLRKRSNETGALNYLFIGLEYLYNVVRQAEFQSRSHLMEMDACVQPPMTSEPQVHPSVRICAFHWYATTACNFVRTIAWMRQKQDASAPNPVAYVAKVLPEVKSWRDKVAAHFAFHSPNQGDTAADELASVIPPTANVNGRFVAGAYSVTVTRSGRTGTSKLRPWSLTEVHEQLCNRYGISVRPPRYSEPSGETDGSGI